MPSALHRASTLRALDGNGETKDHAAEKRRIKGGNWANGPIGVDESVNFVFCVFFVVDVDGHELVCFGLLIVFCGCAVSSENATGSMH